MNYPITFTLSGMDDNGIERQFSIHADDSGFVCKLLTPQILGMSPFSKSFNLKEGCRILRAYNNNYGGENSYQQREFFKPFYDLNLTTTQDNLIRTFAVSSAYTQFWYSNAYENHPSGLEYYKEFTESLSDRILIDWTGTLDVQPQMYFLPVNLKEKNILDGRRSHELEELYRLRLVQKYECSFAETKYSNYYVPFLLPDTDGIIKRFQYTSTIDLWKTIVEGINKEVLRLVRKNKE